MYRYEFAKRKNTKNFKTRCPSCKQKNSFNLYWDNLNQELAPDIYGKCDRLNSCGYVNRPEHKDNELPTGVNFLPKPIDLPTTYIDREDLIEYSSVKHKYPFSIWLIEKFGDVAKEVLYDYAVYSMEIKAWNCYAPLFLYVDEQGNCRSGKMMRYEINNGEPKRTNYEDSWDNMKWLHTWIDGYNYEQIAFGSHLLAKYPEKDVMIVESEKTALILSCVRPQYIWLASLSYTGVQSYLLPDLRNRNVTLIPDKGKKTFDYWFEKSQEFLQENLVLSINCSTFVEEGCKELKEGEDLADYIIKKL